MGFSLDPTYIDVAARIVEFRTKHPDGSLQQLALDFREVAGSWWVVFTAAAYRSPDDQRPGHGTAWEPVPGTTPYTKGSEVQNCETAAWGRAIVAALAADTKKGIASAEEIRNRQTEQLVTVGPDPVKAAKDTVWRLAKVKKPGATDETRAWMLAAAEAQGADLDNLADLNRLIEAWS